MVAAKHLAHFVQDEGIGSATEGGEFYHVQARIGVLAHEIRRFEDTVGVCPLAERVQFV